MRTAIGPYITERLTYVLNPQNLKQTHGIILSITIYVFAIHKQTHTHTRREGVTMSGGDRVERQTFTAQC